MKRSAMFWILAGGAVVVLALCAARWTGGPPAGAQCEPARPALAPTQDPGPVAMEPIGPSAVDTQPTKRTPGLAEEPTATAPSGHVVSGAVRTAEGTPAEGVSVSLRPIFEDSGKETRAAYRDLVGREHSSWHAYTGSDGGYRFEGVPSFRYTFSLEEVPYHQCPSKVRIDADHEQSFQLPPGLRFGGVVSAEDDEGVAVTIEMAWCHNPDPGFGPSLGMWRTLSTQAGTPFLMDGLRPGLYDLKVTAEGHASIYRPIELLRSRLNERIPLQKSLTLAGRVEIGFETRRKDATFWLDPAPSGSWLFNDWEEGTFHFDDCAPGVYDLTVKVQATEAGTRDVERTFRFQLDRDMENLVLPIQQDPPPTWITVERPATDAWVDGWLTATCGMERFEELVRLFPGQSDTSYQVLKPSRGHSKAGAWGLPLHPGVWDLELKIPGYADWNQQLEVDELRSDTVVACLVPHPGCVVRADIREEYVVEYRRHGNTQRWNTLLDSSAQLTNTSTIDEPMTAWLAPGTYDIRIETCRGVEEVREAIQVLGSSAPLVLRPNKTTGLAIQGTVECNTRLDHGHSLFLWRKAGGTWERKRSKTSGIYPEYDAKRLGFQFRFQGLRAGQYRATLDESGSTPVAEWTLTNRDLTSEHIVHQFLP